MKNIEIDEELYQFIAANTQYIGESASSILRRLLSLESKNTNNEETTATIEEVKITSSAAIQSEAEAVLQKAEQSTKQDTKQSTKQAIKQDIGSVFDHINKEELAMQRGAVGRFLLILGALYRVHATQFSRVTEIRGRDRLYFAKSEAELDASGSSTKPRQIPESPFWVITNSNTTRKKMMLTEVAAALGYEENDAANIRELL